MIKEEFWNQLDELLKRRIVDDRDAQDTSIDKAIDDLISAENDPEILSYAQNMLTNYDRKAFGQDNAIISRIAMNQQMKLQAKIEQLQYNNELLELTNSLAASSFQGTHQKRIAKFINSNKNAAQLYDAYSTFGNYERNPPHRTDKVRKVNLEKYRQAFTFVVDTLYHRLNELKESATTIPTQDRQAMEYTETLQNLERAAESVRGVNLEEPSLDDGDIEAQFDTYYTQLSQAKRVAETNNDVDELTELQESVEEFSSEVSKFEKISQPVGKLRKSLSTTINKIREKASDLITFISDKVNKISFSEKLLNLTVELSTLKPGSARYEKIDKAIEALVDTTDLAQLKAAYELISQKQGHLNFPPKSDHEKFAETAEDVLERLNLSMSEIEYVESTKSPFVIHLASIGTVAPAVDPAQNLVPKLISLIQQKQLNRLDPNLKRSGQIEADLENLLSQQGPTVLLNAIDILNDQLYSSQDQADKNKVKIFQDAKNTILDRLNKPTSRLDEIIGDLISQIKEKNPKEIFLFVMGNEKLGEFVENISDFNILNDLVKRVKGYAVDDEGAVAVVEGIKLTLALQYLNIYENLKDTPQNKEALLNAMGDLVESIQDNKARDGLREYANGNVHRLIELSQQLSNPRNLNRLNVIESDINSLMDNASPEIFDWAISLMQTKLESSADPIFEKAIKYLEEQKQTRVATTPVKVEERKATSASFLKNVANKLKRKSFTEQIFSLTEALSTSKLRGKLLTQATKLINKTNDPTKLEEAANYIAAKMSDKEFLKAEYPSPEALRRFQISAEQVIEKLRDKAASYLSFNERLMYHADKLFDIQEQKKDHSKILIVREFIDTLIKEARSTQLADTETFLREKLDEVHADNNYRILLLNIHAKVSEQLSNLTGEQPKSAEVATKAPSKETTATVKAASPPLPEYEKATASRESLQFTEKDLEALRYPQSIDEESSEEAVKRPSLKNELYAVIVTFAKVKDNEEEKAKKIVAKISRLIAKATVEDIRAALQGISNKKPPANLSALEKKNFEIVLNGVRNDLEGALDSKSMKAKVPGYVKSAVEPARAEAKKGKSEADSSSEEKLKKQ